MFNCVNAVFSRPLYSYFSFNVDPSIIDLGVLIKQAVMVYFTDTCFIDTKAKVYNFFRKKLKKPLLIQIVLH